jgi:hypothetical protein
MKRFTRLLPLFFLPLVALAWPCGSEVGAAMYGGGTARGPSAAPEIISFTATPSVVRTGQQITLRWQVSRGASHIWVSTHSEFLSLSVCVERLSGELQYPAGSDVIYRLHVWSPDGLAVKEAPVQVSDAPGFCTITGLVTRDRREYRTRINLYRLNSTAPTSSTATDDTGQYSFTGVPAGIYQVTLSGSYPPGRRPVQPSKQVECWPNQPQRANFFIGGGEG